MNSSDLQEVRLESKTTVRSYVELALRGLPQMFDSHSGLFCHKLKKTAGGSMEQEGLSPRYTAMTLMGLHRLEKNGIQSPIALKPVLERLLSNTEWAENVGDLGVLLWLCAQLAPDRIEELERRLPIVSALSRFPDAREGITMHLAWFLTGLSCCSLALGDPEKMKDVARETYGLLIRNQGNGAYFGHQSTQSSLKGRLRGFIGSFADQVYPIYGMAEFYRAYQDDSALQRARECASAICEAQGPLGQWWWHYDSRNGRVFEEYPVFSVHQHGMAPMTLFALGKVTQTTFDPWIYKGLDWINRHNELSVNMEDPSANVIWRCIQPPALKRYSDALLGTHRDKQHPVPAGLSVLFECRPYELGWLLYGLVDAMDKSIPAR